MRISDWSSDVCSSDLPVAARGARCGQRLDRGNDADADDDEVGGDDFAVRQPNTGDALGALDRFDRDAEPQVDAMLAVLAFVETRQFGARDARENTTFVDRKSPRLNSSH